MFSRRLRHYDELLAFVHFLLHLYMVMCDNNVLDLTTCGIRSASDFIISNTFIRVVTTVTSVYSVGPFSKRARSIYETTLRQ